MIDPQLLAAARALDPEPIADLALELVRLWSPPGDESAMAARVAQALTEAGVRVRIDEEFDGSPSVIGEIGADVGSGSTLQWHGHLDAINVPQGEPYRTEDRLVGRGAADMKGPLASFVAAARLLVDHGIPKGGRVLITFHGRHESGGNEPLHALIRRGIHGDAVITGELGGGTELPTGALGLTFWKATLTSPGAGVHEVFADPSTVDGVEAGRQLLNALAELRARLAGEQSEGTGPSLFIGRFGAGDYPNRVAPGFVIEGSRRHTTATRLTDVQRELEELVAGVRAATGAPIQLDVTPIAEAYESASDEPLVVAARDAHHALTGVTLPLTRSRAVSNAVHFVDEAGIPAICYGPDPATNHGDNESIAVGELSRLAGGFAVITARWLAMTTGSDADRAASAESVVARAP